MFNAPNSINAIWTAERCEQLKMLWANGYSASVIAEKMADCFGHCFSSSAVIGKIHRMKLPHPVGKRVAQPRKFANPSGGKTGREGASKVAVALTGNSTVATATTLSPDEIYGPGLQIIHLNRENCHYPHGDPRVHGFEFCGAPALKGTPWCAYHARRIYLQPS